VYRPTVFDRLQYFLYLAPLLYCHRIALPLTGFKPRWLKLFYCCNTIGSSTVCSGLKIQFYYSRISVSTYSNPCSDRKVIRQLTFIFESEVWSTDSNVLYMVLNSGIANIAVIIRADIK
jgi:hypothetical protein